MPFESPDLARNESGNPLQAVHSLDALSVSCLLGSVSAAALFLIGLFLLFVRLLRMVVASWCDLPATLVGQIPHRHHPLQGAGGRPGRAAMAGRAGGGGGGTGTARAAAGLAEHHVRVQSVARDTELDLPPSLPLPDGEEFPGTANHIHIRTADQEKEIYEACIRPPPNRTVYSRELWTAGRPAARPTWPPRPPLPCLLDGLAGRGPVKPSPVIPAPASAPAPWPLTVVVPRHNRAPPPPPPPSPPASAAAAQLSQYSNDAGTRLSGVRVVGCRAVAPPVASWDAAMTAPVLTSDSARPAPGPCQARLQ